MSGTSHRNSQGLPSVDRRDGGNLTKLTPDVIKNLTEKLSEIVGEDVTQGFEESRNERGELLNEEGLPIIDITEPMATADTRGTENALLAEDAVLPSLSNLPDAVREQLRQQRDRILDQLEDEERLQQIREEEADLEERQEILRKRKEAAAKEREKLKTAKEMQKKMGRALVRNIEKERTEEEKSLVIEVVSDDVNRSSQDKKPTKKTVAFADAPEECHDSQRPPTAQQHALDWGDLTPARLRSTGRPSLLPSDNRLPMKMTVIERTPSAPPKTATIVHPPDSDDESDPDFGSVDGKPDGDADDIDNLDAELALEEEEFDLDFAQHQREIAVEYYEKRNKFGAAALAAMTSHSHERAGDVHVDIPLDLPSSQPEKPPISRFKAEHLISSYKASTSPSTSLSASVIPAATARTMQKAIRTGKLDAEGRLVGGDADSASEEEDEGVQELVELLQKGELYNLGPGGNLVVPPAASKSTPTSLPASLPSTAEKMPFSNLPPIDRPKTSKFKLSRANAGRPSGPSLPLGQTPGTDTPVSVIERSPPKLQPAMTSNIVERPSAKHPSASTPTIIEKSSPKPPTAMNPTVAERHPAATVSPATTSPFPSMIIDSPSFPPPAAVRTASPGGAAPFSPMVVDSPSFAKPKPEVPVVASSRPSHPPTIVSSGARESSHASSGSTSTGSQARPGKSRVPSDLITAPEEIWGSPIEGAPRKKKEVGIHRLRDTFDIILGRVVECGQL